MFPFFLRLVRKTDESSLFHPDCTRLVVNPYGLRQSLLLAIFNCSHSEEGTN